jgi:cytochrome c-type biogenesis protein CcmE
VDVAPLDVTPRAPRQPRPRRRWWAFVVIVGLLAVAAFVATKALGDAALFFYNADEAVAKKDELGDKQFRLQGTVQDGTIVKRGEEVDFVVAFNGVTVPVVHHGDPPELFRAGQPVVLEGHWDQSSATFDSSRMLVKHDAEYDEDNPDRQREAEQGGTTPVSPVP